MDARGQTIRRVVMVCVAMACVYAVAFLLQKEDQNVSLQNGFAPASGAMGPNYAGTIRLAREGDTCRQLQIDNITGRLSQNGRVNCTQTTIPSAKQNTKDLYRGERIEAIRNSFTGN
jgi:hypothetical protein